MRTDVLGFDASAIEVELKIVVLEFRTIVMNDSLRPRVACQPMIVKETLCVFAIFLALEANNFDEVSNWIDTCESIEC